MGAGSYGATHSLELGQFIAQPPDHQEEVSVVDDWLGDFDPVVFPVV
jgi:hypothetical protein